MKNSGWKILGFVTLGVVAIFGLIQLVPYGRNHVNPPIVQEPKWDSPQTRALAVRACFDCHSNETVWPWYSKIAPVSWLVQRDVEEGRDSLNFSNIQSADHEFQEAGETVLEGEMPPAQYFPTHPEARLSNAERIQLAQGLDKSLQGN